MLFAWVWCILCDGIRRDPRRIRRDPRWCDIMSYAFRLDLVHFLRLDPNGIRRDPRRARGKICYFLLTSSKTDGIRCRIVRTIENSYLQLETAWPASFQFQVRFLAQDPQGNGPKIRVQTIQLVTTCHFLTWTCGYYPPRPPPRVGDGGGEAVSS